MKIRSIISALLALSTAVTAPARAEDSKADDIMQATNLHHLITKQQGWLNTSRALVSDDLKGRILLLDFWTLGCINCIHIIPDLKYLEDTFGNDLTVIGVHSAKFKNESDSENIRKAIMRYDLHHAVVNDFDFAIWKSFGVRAWPTQVLINPKGIIESTYSGEGHRKALERDIRKLKERYAGRMTEAPLPIALEKDRAADTLLSFPGKVIYAEDVNGSPALIVSDSGHQRIVVMDMDGKVIDTIGSGAKGHADGAFDKAGFSTPQGLVYKDGVLYIADTNNHLIRAADMKTREVTTLAGTGSQGYERATSNRPALEASLASPWDVTFYPDDNHLVIAMAGTHQLWSYDLKEKTVSAIAGNGAESIDDGKLPQNSLSQPSGLSVLDGTLYFVDAETSSLRSFDGNEIRTLIGTGLFDFGYKEGKKEAALMQHALGLVATESGIYIADTYNHSIRRYDLKTGTLSNYAGHNLRGRGDGLAAKGEFSEPAGITHADGRLYIADTNNHAIRVIDLKTKTISTLKMVEKK